MRTISGYESRRSPYPQRRSFYRGLAPSPIKFTQKRLSRLSQLSFSPSTTCVERRGLSSPRSSASLPTSSLPGLALNEPSSSNSLEGWPEPRRGISRRAAASPTLTDPAHACARVCPGRPFSICKERGERFRRGLALRMNRSAAKCVRIAFDVYGIERQDCSDKIGFRLSSLPRTGRASLLASSATSTRT